MSWKQRAGKPGEGRRVITDRSEGSDDEDSPLKTLDGDVVFLDHTEKWIFKTGETAEHRFATMHELRDGKIAKESIYYAARDTYDQLTRSASTE